MTRTLLITNDFPPRPGGIQHFAYNLAVRQPAGSLVVYASTWPSGDPSQAARFDAGQPFEVVREKTAMLLPTPAVARRAADLARMNGCETVWFGAAAPLGLLAAGLRQRTAIRHAVAQTHGHEAGWAALPAARGLLRRIGDRIDVVTYLAEYFRRRFATSLAGRTRLVRLAPGVDLDTYHPNVDGGDIRRRHQLVDRPVIVCVSRLVPRKGQDTLIRALPRIRQRIPDAALLMVGGGRYGAQLRRLARSMDVDDHVVFTGEVPWVDVPSHFAAGDVFAMPCRTRRRGLDVEGLGMVYLEAAACGLPVVAGDSGGAPEAVRHGETGYVVSGRDLDDLAERLATLLTDRDTARRMGRAGRAFVESEWGWDLIGEQMSRLLRAA